MKHLEVCVQITIKPTEASVDADRVATRVDAGQFRLVLKEGSLFDIDALEAGVLRAMRRCEMRWAGRWRRRAGRKPARCVAKKGGLPSSPARECVPSRWGSRSVSVWSFRCSG
jgi:hypothetical protein